MKKLKSYIPYLIPLAILLGSIIIKGIVKWNYKQQQADYHNQQQEERMNNLKDSLKNLGNGNTVRAK